MEFAGWIAGIIGVIAALLFVKYCEDDSHDPPPETTRHASLRPTNSNEKHGVSVNVISMTATDHALCLGLKTNPLSPGYGKLWTTFPDSRSSGIPFWKASQVFPALLLAH